MLGSSQCLSIGTSGLCLPGPLYAHQPILCYCVVLQKALGPAGMLQPVAVMSWCLWFLRFQLCNPCSCCRWQAWCLSNFCRGFSHGKVGEDSEAGTSWILARTGKHWVGHLSTFVCLEVGVCSLGPFRVKVVFKKGSGSWLTWARQKLPQDQLMWFKPQCDGMLARFSIPCASLFILFQTWWALSSARTWLIFWISLLQ